MKYTRAAAALIHRTTSNSLTRRNRKMTSSINFGVSASMLSFTKNSSLISGTNLNCATLSAPVVTKFLPMKLGAAGKTRYSHHQTLARIGDHEGLTEPASEEVESFLHMVIGMSFPERLSLAWRTLFPSPSIRKRSVANVAKQRLKMILFSDRCAVSDEAKQKIVTNIVNVLSDFVEIESRDKVQLSVSTDPSMGTVYSVSVPVRDVKPEYQDQYDPGTILSMEYKDTGEESGSVDVKFDFYVPDSSQ